MFTVCGQGEEYPIHGHTTVHNITATILNIYCSHFALKGESSRSARHAKGLQTTTPTAD